MTITYPLAFPTTLTVSSMTISPRDAIARTESPFSFSEQVVDFTGEVWQVSGTLPLMEKDTAEDYVSFILKLKGRKGTFLFPIPNAEQRGVATGTPLVKGAGQTGNSLALDGMTPNITGIFKAGDFLNLGSGSSTRLYKILSDVNSDGSGNVTVDIWPSLRSSPADNAVITLSNVKVLLRLSDNVPYSIDTNKHYFLEFSAQEAL